MKRSGAGSIPTSFSYGPHRLRRDDRRVAVFLRRGASRDFVLRRLERENLTLDSARVRGASSPHIRINESRLRYWVSSPEGRKLPKDVVRKIRRALGDRVHAVMPAFRMGGWPAPFGVYCPKPAVLLSNTDDRTGSEAENPARILKSSRAHRVTFHSMRLLSHDYHRLATPDPAQLFAARGALLAGGVKALLDLVPMVDPRGYEPNDVLYDQQWNLLRIDAPGAWEYTQGHSTVVIAIIDSGVDLEHPDLEFASTGISLDDPSSPGVPSPTASLPFHGTACAGIAAACTDNEEGMAGVAGKALILPIAAEAYSAAEIAAGIAYAVEKRARVINMSMGFIGRESDPLLDPALEAAYRRGITLCANTGNFAEDLKYWAQDDPTLDPESIQYPGIHPNVIAVGSVRRNNWRAKTSQYGPGISVMAPGSGVITTDMRGASGNDRSGDYTVVYGTSFAAPHVTGIAALMMTANPLLGPFGVRSIVERTATQLAVGPRDEIRPNGRWNPQYGHGLVNARAAVEAAGFAYAAQQHVLFNLTSV